MARRATGQVIPPKGKQRSWALRFRAYGQREYVTLGRPEDGWDRGRAEEELRHILADVERGMWRPHEPEPIEAPREVPTFHEFASEWFEANKPGWAPRTVADYQWALSHHLLPYFAKHRLDAITIEEVDRYRAAKLREAERLVEEREAELRKPPSERRRIPRPLAPAQINKTLKRLSQILEVAEEYGHIPRNPARGRRRRVKAPKVQRSWVEPEQALPLIEAGSTYMRPVIATLIGAGLRVSEAVALDWSHVNLATGTLRVGKAKTDAGTYREVDLPAGLVNELTEWGEDPRVRAARVRWRERNPEGGDPLFLSAHAGRIRRQSSANVARRLKTAIRGANHQLADLGIEPISERVTPHSLRRTYASIRAASGDDPVYIAEQLGHTDIRVTTRYYTKAVKRRAKLSGQYLAEYERALAWAALPGSEKAETGRISPKESQHPIGLSSDLA
jgi:integrase